jgi:hypothetical protein
VKKGDPLDRARLSYLRTGALPNDDLVAQAESGQTLVGGWPAGVRGKIPSIDATCFRLAELDDLGALSRPAARRALYWLASRQRPDGTWEEEESLAAQAPPWAQPGDPEAALYLTANAAFWLTAARLDARSAGLSEDPAVEGYAQVVASAAEVLKDSLNPDGTWPSFLVTGWLSAAVFYRQDMFYEAARVQMVLTDRLPTMSPADAASMASSLRRVGIATDEWTMIAARKRLTETQRTDGGWPSDDGDQFDVHSTLSAIRAIR